MTETKTHVSISLDKIVIEKLDVLAKKQKRSRSYMANEILINGFK